LVVAGRGQLRLLDDGGVTFVEFRPLVAEGTTQEPEEEMASSNTRFGRPVLSARLLANTKFDGETPPRSPRYADEMRCVHRTHDDGIATARLSHLGALLIALLTASLTAPPPVACSVTKKSVQVSLHSTNAAGDAVYARYNVPFPSEPEAKAFQALAQGCCPAA
jgi:hypothetical protein